MLTKNKIQEHAFDWAVKMLVNIYASYITHCWKTPDEGSTTWIPAALVGDPARGSSLGLLDGNHRWNTLGQCLPLCLSQNQRNFKNKTQRKQNAELLTLYQ